MQTLPSGVTLKQLTSHADDRGAFTEIFRHEWDSGCHPIQWNLMSSNACVLRGVHVHPRHDDYLVLTAGRASIGLRDLRQGSPTEGLPALVEVDAADLAAIFIPHGVAHGFYFPEASALIYGVSHYWDTDDEKGCLWSDPALEIPWPVTTAQVSASDAAAQSLSDLLLEIAPRQPI